MVKLYQTEGIVLRTRDYGEADKLVTLLTSKAGKVPGIAKGVRRPRSRLRAGVELAHYGCYQLYAGRTLDTVTQYETRNTFNYLRIDWQRYVQACYLLELLDAVLPDREGGPEFLSLVLATLHLLESVEPAICLRMFESRLLVLMGFGPELESCIHCGTTGVDGVKFSVQHGGILCVSCQGKDPAAVKIEQGLVATWQHLVRINPAHLPRLRINPGYLRQLEGLLSAQLQLRLEIHPKTCQVLRELDNPHKRSWTGEHKDQ